VDEDLVERFLLPPSIRKCREDTLQTEVMNFYNCNFPVPSLCPRYRHFSVLLSSRNIGMLRLCSIRLLLRSFKELSHL